MLKPARGWLRVGVLDQGGSVRFCESLSLFPTTWIGDIGDAATHDEPVDSFGIEHGHVTGSFTCGPPVC